MALADTATLVVNLLLKDGISGPAKTASGGLSNMQKTALGVATVMGGALTAGALSAEKAQGKFMAATGKSREEAEKFVSGMDSLAGSAGAVGVSFDEIAATGTMVEQQFGTTGQATTDLTELVLEFAKVTGQDAEQAAGDLDDTLTAYGLTAADAAGFTDELVASTQKYGVDVGPAQLDLIRKISPALQDMGGDIDDATGFLIAMEGAGIDATDAQKGFNAALQNVPPGTTIDDLVKHFSDLKAQGIDPTAEAIKIFGAKAGPALLKAIQPGMDGLDDLAVSAEDAAGSLGTAAGSMVTTSDKIKGLLDKIGAGFREVGQEFGPFVTGIAAVAPAAGAAVTKIWTAMGGADSAVGKAASAAGITSGRLFGLGAVLGIGAVLTVGIMDAFDQAKNAVENNPAGLDSIDLFQARAPMWAKAKISVQQQMQAISTEALVAFNTEWNKGIAAGLSPQAALEPARQAGLVIGNAVGTSTVQAVGEVVTGSGREELYRIMHNMGVDGIDALGRGFNDSAAGLADDARETMSLANRALMVEAENARAAGIKQGNALADGLNASLPGIHTQWDQWKESMKNALNPMHEIAWLEGRLSGDRLAEALNSKNPLTRRSAEVMRDQMQSELDDLKTLMGQDGTQGSTALANNLNPGPAVAAAQAIMRRLAAIFDHQFHVSVTTNYGGEHGYSGGGRASGGPVKAGQVYKVNEDTPRSEWWMPNVDGTVIPYNGISSGGVMGGGGQQNLNISLTARVVVSAREVVSSVEHVQRLNPGMRNAPAY